MPVRWKFRPQSGARAGLTYGERRLVEQHAHSGLLRAQAGFGGQRRRRCQLVPAQAGEQS